MLSICKANQEEIPRIAPKTVPLQPLGESSVLSRVRTFLPILDEANRKLTKAIKEKGAKEYDIEVLNGHERDSYVEMDLALGVADLHTASAISAAERQIGGQVVDATLSRNEEDSDNEDGKTDSSEGEENIEAEKDHKNLLSGRKKRPRIEPLN